MRFRFSLLAACLLLLPSPALAQVVWDSPLFAAPRPDQGYAFYLFEPHGADLGILGTWSGPGLSGVRLRFGIADGASGSGVAVLGGGDYAALLRSADDDFPFEVGWVIGLGFGYKEWLTLTVPFGASIGLPVRTEDLRITPWLTPRVVVDAFLADDERGADPDGTDLDFAADLGLDVGIGETWGVRFSATLGGREALGIGLVF